MAEAATPRNRPRIVVIGAGFAGIAAAKRLARHPVDVVLIDRHNYHLFQPLLYQVATAALADADIASPIRSILRNQENVTILLAEVSEIDMARREVLAEGRRVPFDSLIVATGAQHAYFGNDHWEDAAPGLKTIDDATRLRRRILLAFERAETALDPAERQRQLTFTVVGGGPTGVEMAGAIAELAKQALAADFRMVDPRQTRIILVEAGPKLLPAFDDRLIEAAQHYLTELGVEVRLDAPVTDCARDHVMLGEERIDTRTVVWAAGVEASPAGKWLDAEADKAGRVKVAPDLSVPGHAGVYVVGDAAHAADAKGNPLPGVAAVAKQQGEHVADALIARLEGRKTEPFRYRDHGSLATVGRRRAVAEVWGFKLSGRIAWIVWTVAHVFFLVGFRNRLMVTLNWLWSFFTYHRGARLITGITGADLHEVKGDPGRERAATARAGRSVRIAGAENEDGGPIREAADVIPAERP